MNHLWKALFLASLAVIGLLSFRLAEGKRESRLMAERQDALKGQIALLSERRASPAPAPAEAAFGERQVPESEIVRKPDRNPLVTAWQRRFAEFRHRDMLRYAWFRYHEAVARLNLPRDKQAQLLELLRAREEAANDARDAANAAGITDYQEIDRAATVARNEVAREIAGLVGESGLESLDNFQAMSMQVMGIDRSVGADLGMEGIPLTRDQETELAQVYVDVAKQFSTSSFDGFHGPSDMAKQQADSQSLILSRAEAILAPDQLAALKAYFEYANQRAKLLDEAPK